jgi:sec-independent protein translocase protein TatB
MFGFSFAELLVVALVALIFIKPQDLPEIAHFIGKVFYRGKSLFKQVKQSLKEMEKELGLDDLKNEMNRGIAEEKSKLEEEMTVIVDMDGNEHLVPNVKNLRSDLTKEEIALEVAEMNKKNSQIKKSEEP